MQTRPKLQSLDNQEANVEWERWAVSDSDSSEEEQGRLRHVNDGANAP